MRRGSSILVLAVVALAAAALGACGGETPAAVPFAVELSPQFVQGAIPQSATGVLVTISNESPTEAPVALTATAEGAQVTVTPAEIGAGEVAEVTVIAEPAVADRPLEIVVTGRRGDLESRATRSTTVFAWEDDRGEYARTLLAFFTAWLADNEPRYGIGPQTEFSGSFVAPGLLVVSHYMFLSEEWEVGLSWHIMVPPHDWAEIYLRRRGELVPTAAFRLRSQAETLEEGTVIITAVTPPEEVLR